MVTDAEIDAVIAEMQASTAAQSLHTLFDQQIRAMMDDAGMSEEEKQSALVALACPCCGGAASSFTYKIRSKD
jgi:hypothetical protein